MRNLIYKNAWAFWMFNFGLTVFTYNGLFSKIWLIFLCFLLILFYVGIEYFVLYKKKQLQIEIDRRRYGRDMYIGKYRAVINQNFTKEEYFIYLSVFDATQAFKERNGYFN